MTDKTKSLDSDTKPFRPWRTANYGSIYIGRYLHQHENYPCTTRGCDKQVFWRIAHHDEVSSFQFSVCERHLKNGVLRILDSEDFKKYD